MLVLYQHDDLFGDFVIHIRNVLLFPTHLMCTRHSISERLRTYSWFQLGSVKFISGVILQVLLYTFNLGFNPWKLTQLCQFEMGLINDASCLQLSPGVASTKSEAEQEEAEEQIEDLISSFAHDLVKVNQGSNKETEDEEENEQDDDQEEVLIAGGVSNIEFVVLYTVFPQLKNKFPGMNSDISWNLTQFPDIEEGYRVRVTCPRKFTICTT